MGEQERVLKSFCKAFESSKELPRALYGIGVNTKYLLEHIEGYEIISLMDQENEGEVIYDLPVVSPEEVIGKIKEIVIITRFIHLNIVYQRIKHLESSGIIIKGPDGADLSLVFSENAMNFSSFPYPEEAELRKKLKGAEVVSFDLFDTLVQRTVLVPEDIFKLVEEESGFKDFSNIRKQAQKESQVRWGGGQGYQQIYRVFQELTLCTDDECDILKEMEIKTELSCIIPRKSAVTVLKNCVSVGKPVFIVSDMYLSVKILEEILARCEIVGYESCIVSSEEGKTKESGELFDVLKEKVGNKRILHIGDNLKADILNAQEKAMDAFHFMSYYQLLANSPFSCLLPEVVALADSMIMGHIFSDLFDSPFALSQCQGRFFMDSVEKFGKLCISPLLLGYLSWQNQMLKEVDKPRVLYMARDGFLLYEIHQELRKRSGFEHLPPCDYVLSSRRGLVFPTLRTEEDILDYINIHTIREMSLVSKILEERMGVSSAIDFAQFDLEEGKKELTEFLRENVEGILKNAKEEREEYRNYLDSFYFLKEERIFVFDLATRGTIKNSFNKLGSLQAEGICFLTLDVPEEDESFMALFGRTTFYGRQKYFLSTSFMFLESAFASNAGQFISFQKGNPVYREEQQANLLPQLQDYVKHDVVSRLVAYGFDRWGQCSLSLIDSLYRCLKDDFCIFSQELKELFFHEDPFSDKTEHLFDMISMTFE